MNPGGRGRDFGIHKITFERDFSNYINEEDDIGKVGYGEGGGIVLDIAEGERQGVTKRCCLCWLTNRALVYEPKCGVPSSEYSCTHGAQINFGNLTPYLTYGERGQGAPKRKKRMGGGTQI
jgi:hypothetical protein